MVRYNGEVKMIDIEEVFEEAEANVSFDILDNDMTHDILLIRAGLRPEEEGAEIHETVAIEVNMTKNQQKKLAKLLLSEW